MEDQTQQPPQPEISEPLTEVASTEVPVEKSQATPPPPLIIEKKMIYPYLFGAGMAVIVIAVGAFFLGISTGRAQMSGIKKVPEPTPTMKPKPTKAVSHSANPMTANWNTYTNSAIGFTLRYPPRFGKPTLPTVPGAEKAYATGSEKTGSLTFGISPDSFTLSLAPFTGTAEELLTSQVPLPADQEASREKQQEISVAGLKAYSYTVTPEASTSATISSVQKVYFVGNEYGFILTAGSNYSPQEIDYILSSIDFTN